MSYFKDLREYLRVLEENDKLVRVKKPMVKETEIFPLVRIQFAGLPEDQRKGFLFENIIDVTGRSYPDWSVAIGVNAASRQVYALGLGCKPSEINERWNSAMKNPIEPRLVDGGPVHEEVHMGDELKEVGLDEIPVVAESPGLAGITRTTTQWVTKDPESGVQNVGNYGGKFTSRNTLHWGIGAVQHGFLNWKKWKALGKPMPAAIIAGSSPNIAYCGTARLPYGVDEFGIAGGMAGEPVDLVKCKTVDIAVPATAEVVIEGEVSTEFMEPMAAFPEYTGYLVDPEGQVEPVMNVTCITHRKNPIFTTIISNMPPSESSKIRQIANEGILLKHLTHDCNITGVLDISVHDWSGADMLVVIQMKKGHPTTPWQALGAACMYDTRHGKMYVAVDDDIDPTSLESVIWALSFRMQPHRDIQIIKGRSPGLDPSGYPPGLSKEERSYPGETGSSAILMDATRKFPYPAVALPMKEYMERGLEIWKELGLPEVHLPKPWHGYILDVWDEDAAENAKLITEGKFHVVGEKLASKRVPV